MTDFLLEALGESPSPLRAETKGSVAEDLVRLCPPGLDSTLMPELIMWKYWLASNFEEKLHPDSQSSGLDGPTPASAGTLPSSQSCSLERLQLTALGKGGSVKFLRNKI